MSEKTLGLGMMRLPVTSDGKIDIEQVNTMVDKFIDNGFYYFDTSYVYHNGESEGAFKRAIADRYSHDKYTVATKFPTFAIKSEDEIEPIFAKQLENLGVDYVDYYLLHNIQTIYYDGIDGSGGIIKKTNLFDHLKAWKEAGKVKHIGFSFHSSAKILDKVLTEHPEVEFVQIVVNYYDYEAEMIQARECCEVIQKHGKEIMIMEPVKGGMLAKLPGEAETLLKNERPDDSIASWALRYLLARDFNIKVIISGMSNMAQVEDNIKTMAAHEPLNSDEEELVEKVVKIIKGKAPITTDTIEKYRGLDFYGVPMTAMLGVYSSCMSQPVPTFAADLNYIVNAFAENSHIDFAKDKDKLEVKPIILPDGSDGTEDFVKALDWFKENHF